MRAGHCHGNEAIEGGTPREGSIRATARPPFYSAFSAFFCEECRCTHRGGALFCPLTRKGSSPSQMQHSTRHSTARSPAQEILGLSGSEVAAAVANVFRFLSAYVLFQALCAISAHKKFASEVTKLFHHLRLGTCLAPESD
jgi:hypothetical protein